MNSKKLAEAAAFAAKAHEGIKRKGTDIPYISHLLEAGLIAMTLTEDEDVVIAAFLHDVIEDTAYDLSDIEKQFGNRVASLVKFESEDKMKGIPAADSWKNRKTAFLEHLETASLEAKMICLSDKLSNMRLSAKTHAQKGDAMWLAFNEQDKREQEWYYRGIYEKMPELKGCAAYREYVSLCNEVFGIRQTANTIWSERFVHFEPLVKTEEKYKELDDKVESELVRVRDFYCQSVELRKNVSVLCDPYAGMRELPCPHVFLSDRIKTTAFGEYSPEQLAKKMREYLEKMPECPMRGRFVDIIYSMIELLRRYPDIQGFHEELLYGTERMVKSEGTDKDKEIFEGILELIVKLKTKCTALGEYLPERHQIILYYKAIEKDISRDNHNLDFDAKLSSVLAHEYFHAMHYASNPKNTIWSHRNSNGLKNYQKLELTESLADFFSVLWCFNESAAPSQKFVDVAENRIDSWISNFYSSWPYSKALYYLIDERTMLFPARVDKRNIWEVFPERFMPVYEKSLEKPSEAYQILRVCKRACRK